jgi:TonB family protein
MSTFDRNWLNRFFRRPPYVAGLLLAMFSVSFQPSAAQEASRKVIAKTAPSYPELAKRMHLAGKVRLEVIITTGGSVKAAHLVGGNPVFENNAIEAVKQWRFEAAPSETKAVVVLEFADQ